VRCLLRREREPLPRVDLSGAALSGDVLDDFDELVHAVPVVTGELDELPRSLNDSPALGRPRDRDATPAPELEQSLVPPLSPPPGRPYGEENSIPSGAPASISLPRPVDTGRASYLRIEERELEAGGLN
jgi:hypothetical protein